MKAILPASPGQGKPLQPVEVFREVGWEGRKRKSSISDMLNLEFESFLNSIWNREMFALNDKVKKKYLQEARDGTFFSDLTCRETELSFQ